MPASERKSFIKAAFIVGGFTLISRVLGVLRDAVVAYRLGATVMSDIFNIAFEIPHLARRVLGEGALSAFIVPIYSEQRKNLGDEEAWRFINNALNAILIFTAILTLMGLLFGRYLFLGFGGFGYLAREGGSEIVQLGAQITRIMFPYVMAMALTALLMGVLHSWRNFTAPSLGSIVLNLDLIAAGLIFTASPAGFLYILSIAVLISGFIRFAILLPPLMKKGYRYFFYFDPKSQALRDLFKMMLPGALGVIAIQLNISINLNFATFLGEGCASYLRYSIRLIQFPQGLIAVSLSTAILPSLTKHLLHNEKEQLRGLMTLAMKMLIVLFVPATVGLCVMGKPLIKVLFERGAFDSVATEGTYLALAYYSLGLLPLSFVQVLAPLFYARKDVWSPFKASVYSIIVNVILNILLFRTTLRHGGLALAYSISTLVNAGVLWMHLKGDLTGVIRRDVLITFFKSLSASIIMGLGCYAFQKFLVQTYLSHSKWLFCLGTLFSISLGVAIFFLIAHLLRMRELQSARELLFRKKSI